MDGQNWTAVIDNFSIIDDVLLLEKLWVKS